MWTTCGWILAVFGGVVHPLRYVTRSESFYAVLNRHWLLYDLLGETPATCLAFTMPKAS